MKKKAELRQKRIALSQDFFWKTSQERGDPVGILRNLPLPGLDRSVLDTFDHYDGTLVPFVKRPQQAGPQPAVLDLLKSLVADSRNCLARPALR